MEIYVLPSSKTKEQENFNISMVNISNWKVESFEDKELKIQLNFSMPLYISQNTVQDVLTLHFFSNASTFVKTEKDSIFFRLSKDRTLVSPLKS